MPVWLRSRYPRLMVCTVSVPSTCPAARTRPRPGAKARALTGWSTCRVAVAVGCAAPTSHSVAVLPCTVIAVDPSRLSAAASTWGLTRPSRYGDTSATAHHSDTPSRPFTSRVVRVNVPAPAALIT